jgi:hypothetical protein
MQSLLVNNYFIIYYAGLLLLRAYAIANHKRFVLTVLGALCGCTLVMDLVCSRVYVHCGFA